MPFDGTATAASITRPRPALAPAVFAPPPTASPPAYQHRPVSATLAANEAQAACGGWLAQGRR